MSVAGILGMGLAGALPEASPLDPSREQAREWARLELSDPVYSQAEPGLLQRAVQWLFERLAELPLRGSALTDPWVALILLVLVLTVVVVAVMLRTGRLRGPGRVHRPRAVFAGSRHSAQSHRHVADLAADDQRWADAVRERFRAVVRSLEERVVIDERPGRTADEAAAEAGRMLPELADVLGAGAGTFDDVVYGTRPATREHDTQLRELDRLVQAAEVQRRSVGAAERAGTA